MHDLIFTNQRTWSSALREKALETFIDYAKELDLDVDQLSKDIERKRYQDLIQQRYDEAVALGLPGTPTLFLNGQYYKGPVSDFALGGLIQLYNYDGPQYTAPPPMTIDPSQPYFATVETNRGSFCIELLPAQAPQTVNSFVFLTQEGFYDGVLFYRVLPEFVAQTGDPTGGGFGGPGYLLDDEIDPDLAHDGPGVVSMFSSGPNTNGSQFFITYQALPNLDGDFTIFGKVATGMDVVNSLTPRDPHRDPYTPADFIRTITIGSTCGM